MTAEKRVASIEALIWKLLSQKPEVSVHDVALASGLLKAGEGDRKAIRRVFNSLIKQGSLLAKGAARARVYVRAQQVSPPSPEFSSPPGGRQEAFKAISLSSDAEALLRHVSQPLQMRTPISYNRAFLRSYRPNETFYLNEAQRESLLIMGRVEAKTSPAGTYARNILHRLLIDLSWNSSRLEGNTYSLLETKRLIELGESATGKDAIEAQMILNHKAAIEYIVESSVEGSITTHEVCSIHALLSENLLGDASASGRLRQILVGIAGTTYMPLENPHEIRECFDVFVKKLNLIEDPFEQSLFSLIHLPYLQAFEDINKRTSRLVANIPLIKENLKPLSFTDVDQTDYVKALLGVYERNDVSLIKDLFVWAYTRSSHRYSAIQQAMGQPDPLKLKYRNAIHAIIRSVILEKIAGSHLVNRIQTLIQTQSLPEADRDDIFKVIETEIFSLHEGNIARFKIRPSEFHEWKRLQ